MQHLRAMYALPFRAIAVVFVIFQFNRAWIAKGLARKHAAGSFKGFILLTIVAWFAIWFLAGDEHRGKLTQAFESFWMEIRK